PELATVEADCREVAELPLAGAHRHGRVALRELDRVEALLDRALHVLVGDILAQADEAAALLPRHGRVCGCLQPAACDRPGRLDPGGDLGRDEDAGRGRVFDPGAGLREQRVCRLPARRGDQQVAHDRFAVDLDAGYAAPASPRRDPRVAPLTEIDDAGNVD